MNTQGNIIKKLDDNIIKLISAGEVIESPCSVVKELVENSIDSKATSIVVDIKNGGKDYIRVSDNGIGIDEQYVTEAFKKHTTSKITTFDDFINVTSNGFRGEALASISAVSKISMITKTSDRNYGINIVISNDRLIEKTKVGAKDGTTVIVEELFNNIPARKKFLKSDKAESSKISDYLIRYALANPNIKIKYINNSKQIFQTYGTGNIKDIINTLFSTNYNSEIINIDEVLSPYISIQGAIGNNSAMFSSRKMQYIFVNGRIIKDKVITLYIENAYKKYIPSGNFPMFFLNIILEPNMVDVNIHPNKLEVKFSDEKIIYNLIENKISEILDSYSMIPDIKLVEEDEDEIIDKSIVSNILADYEKNKAKNPFNSTSYYEKTIQKENYDIKSNFIKNNISSNYDEDENIQEKNTKDSEKEEHIQEELTFTKKYDGKNNFNYSYKDNLKENKKVAEENIVYTIQKDILKYDTKVNIDDIKLKTVDLTLLNYTGRVFDTYIILFDKEDMYMIDQHAAHERILYEKYLKEFYAGDIAVQQLLVPQKIGMDIKLIDSAYQIIEDLSGFGFECDLFGDNIILIRGIPIYFDENGAKNFVDTVFDIYLEESMSNDILKDKIATKACKAAIKGNDSRIKDIEVEKLIYDLEHCENKYSCPHGRPVITRLSKYEIEKFFKRIL